MNRDIHHHQRHEQELADRARDLEDLASVVAHDLRGPLATIPMLLETALRPDVTTTGFALHAPQELLERAVQQADRARATIEALLTLARTRQQQLQLSTVALTTVAMEVVDDLAVAVEQQGARTEVAALPEVTGDPALLRVVLQDLISNALRYRHPDRPPVITVTGSRREDRVSVEIADNGLGIAPEDLDRIFTPGHRSASRTGDGLGLVTARRIVTRLGGTIDARPEQLGTHFVVTLPAVA